MTCNKKYIKRVIGVTRTFSWTITTNGEAQSLEGRDLTLVLIHPRGQKEELDFTTANNVVSFTWQGDDQKELGPYSLILYENYGIANQRRVDIHYFLDLIPWSEKESGSYSDLTEESINLGSQEISGETVVVDNLTSTNPSFALSANMGRVLNEKILALLTPTEATGAQLDTFITEASEGWYLVPLDSGGSMLVQVVMDGPVVYQVALTEPHSGRIMLRHYNTQVPNPAWTEWTDAYVDKLTAADIAFGHVSDSGMKITIGGVDHIVSQTSQPLGSSNAFVAPTWEALTIALATKQDTLTFDSTPTANSNNPVTSQGIKTYVDSHSSGFTVDDALSTTSENPVQNKVVTVALNGKQATIDDLSTIRSGAAAGATAYQKPSGGIPKTDLANAVQTSLGKADSAYQKPGTGIPSSDMASAVQTSLGKADSAYQKPSGGIPESDMASAVQTILDSVSGKANRSEIPSASDTSPLMDGTAAAGLATAYARGDHRHPSDTAKQDVISDLSTIRSGAAAGATAYQKPSTGIPKTDLASAVQSSLDKADAAQPAISTVNVTVDNNTGTPSGSASVSGNTMSFSFQNLKGATGAQGPQGIQGVQGPQGPQGPTGVSGDASSLAIIHGIDKTTSYTATDVCGADAAQTLLNEIEGGFYY